MDKFRTKNEAKKHARDLLKAHDGDMQLFPTAIEAEGEKADEYTGKITLENTEKEAASFIKANGKKINIALTSFDVEERDGRRKVTPSAKRGRQSAIPADAGIVPRAAKKGVDGDDPLANPRREGTFGHTSFEVLRTHWTGNKNAAMRYEDYVKGGGRPNDLRWDWERGHVAIQDPKTGKSVEFGGAFSG